MNKKKHDILVSLPEALIVGFGELFPDKSEWFTASDPSGKKLGSGGGTAYILAECWRQTSPTIPFTEWLRLSTKLIVHGGGQSRRLPAYSPVGKPFIPMPVSRNSIGESLRQTLIDVQLPDYQRILDHIPDNIVAMVTSGDVLLKFGRDIPLMQTADVIAMGMKVSPQQAESFGVFFTQQTGTHDVEFFLQKPASSQIEQLAKEYDFLVDTGIWLLSEDAVMALMSKCGWDESNQVFVNEHPDKYELYSGFGLSLGSNPHQDDSDIKELKASVVSMPSPEFYHLGTSRQLIESMTAIQNRGMASGWSPNAHPDQFILNTPSRVSARSSANHTLWIENSALNKSWCIKNQHVITGVPPNAWNISLDDGICLDFVPVYDNKYCIRFYHIDDEFHGNIEDPSTIFMSDSITCWLDKRGLPHNSIRTGDIISARIFPVMEYEDISDDFINWLISSESVTSSILSGIYLSCEKMSSEDLRMKTNVKRLFAQQAKYRNSAVSHLYKNADNSIFSRLDLKDTADMISGTDD
ncbi:MAG: fucose pyrophosphorylase domain-containing protein, partial [Armatimonadota bacterium]